MKFGIKPLTAKDQIDEWIASVVPNQTFADVGGIGVNSVNERITFAIKCGAKSATMIDFRPSDYYEGRRLEGFAHKRGYQIIENRHLLI